MQWFEEIRKFRVGRLDLGWAGKIRKIRALIEEAGQRNRAPTAVPEKVRFRWITRQAGNAAEVADLNRLV
jgi:hypothetical protein